VTVHGGRVMRRRAVPAALVALALACGTAPLLGSPLLRASAASGSVVYASDSFNRTVANGWGSADTGGAWSASGGAYAVAPGSATIAADSTAPANFLPAVSALDVDELVKISPPPISATWVDTGIAVRYAASTQSFYQLSMYYSSSNNGGNYTVELKRKPENTQINSDVPTGIPGGTAVWLRVEAQGVNPTTLRWKIWQDGTSEPAAWSATGSDSTPALQAAGGVGVIAWASAGTASVAFNSLVAGSIPAPPPLTCPANAVACDTFQRTVSGGWGNADTGGAWSGSGAAFAVTPGAGTIAADSTTPSSFLTSVSVRDVDALVKITPPAPSATFVESGIALRFASAGGTYYQLGMYSSTAGNGGNYSVALKSQPGDVAINPDVTTAIPGATAIWVRFQALGANPTALRWKLWQDGTAEPSGWTATGIDSTAALQVAGAVGVTTFANTGTASVAFDALVATPATPTLITCPTGALDCDTFARSVAGGWGSADSGGAWSSSGSAYNVTPGSASVVADATTPTTFLTTTTVQDVDAVAKVSPPGISAAYVDAGIGVRYSAAGGTFYQLSLYYATANNGGNYTAELKRKPDNVQITPDTPTSVPGGVAVWLRLQAQGVNPSTLRWKIWADGQAEPPAWMGSGTDSTAALQAAGGVGTEAYASSGTATVVFNGMWATAIAAGPPPGGFTCAGGAIACDTFNRTATVGWQNADSGGAWSVVGTPSSWSVSPGTGSVVAAPASEQRAYLGAVSVRDTEVLAKLSLPRSTTTSNTYAFVLGRYAAGTPTYYRVGVLQNSGTPTVALRVQRSDGSQVGVDVRTTIASADGAVIWMRVQFQGAAPTAIRARAWVDGGTEPSQWQFDTTDTTASMQVAGAVGLRVRNDDTAAAHTFAVMGYQAIALPAPPAPSGFDVDTFNRTVTKGWGAASQGGPWNTTGAAYSVTPGLGAIVANPSTLSNFLATQSVQDADVRAWVSPPPTGSPFVDAGVALRYVASTGTFYQLSAFYATASNGGNYTVQLKRKPANTKITADVNTTIPGGTAIWFRLQAQGVNPTTLRWKVWQDGLPEPAAWMGTATDSTAAMQVAGGVGVECFSSNGNATMVFDQIWASTIS
jgi:hypothetical protein